MTIDVILVNYHSSENIRMLVPRIRDFFESPRIYLVNNSPRDGFPDQFVQSHDITYVVNAANRGFAAAVNQATALGNGAIVVLVNPDILDIAGEAAAITDAFNADQRLAAVAVRLLNPDGTLQDSCRREPTLIDHILGHAGFIDRFPRWSLPKRFRMLDWKHDERRHVDAACGAFLALRREAARHVGELDERFFVYWEETEWLLRAKDLGWLTLFLPEVVAVHVGGASGIGISSPSLLLTESELKFVHLRRGPRSELVLRAVLLGIDGLRYVQRRVAASFGHGSPNALDPVRRRLQLYWRGTRA